MKCVKNLSRIAWSKCLLQTLALGAIVLLAAAPARAVTFTWTTNTYLSGTTNFMTLATGWSKLASFSIGGSQVTFGGETWSSGYNGGGPQNTAGPNGFGFDWSRPNIAWGATYNGYDPVSNNIVIKQGGYYNPNTGPYCRLKINGFVPGQEYQVQFIVADMRAAQYGRSVTIQPVSLDGNTLLGGNSPTVQYSYNNGNNNATFAIVTADFVADASTYGFVPWCLDSSSSPVGPQINAIRITTPPAAPILVTWDNGSGSGAWNTTDTNWTGYAWNNSLPNTALITSLPGTTNINLSQNITARDVTWGNLTGSLTNAHTLTVTNSFNVQGDSGNFFPYTNNPTFTLAGPTLNVAGNLGIGRMNLLVSNSTINAKLIASAAVNGAVGDLIISSGAIVRATNGIDYSVNDTSGSSGLELNGGTLYVPSINACDDETDYGGGNHRSIMKWNGGTLVPTADNANFITVYSKNLVAATDTFVENGGAVIDTAGHNIGLGVELRGEGTGGLTKNGNGTLTLSGAINDYTGPTVLNTGSLVLSSGATLPSSSAISIGSGTTFDISAASFVLGTNQVLSGSGTVTGSIVASSGPGSGLNAGTAGMAGTLTITGNMDLSAGATIGFDLSPSASSGNDQIVVVGNLTLSSSDTIHIKGLSGTANLYSSADYVLFSVSGTTAVGSQPALVWDVPKPANYGHYVITTSGNNVVLHYLTGTPPTITSATITPSTLTRNQSAFVSVTVANGTGSVDPNTGVVLAAAQGQVPLVLSATPNVYTNTIVIPASANVGLETNTVTATDSLALSGASNLVVTVVAANQAWNGSGADDNISTNPNWVSGDAPGLIGDSVTFAGNTRLTPNFDANYSFTGITFDSTAGSFNLGTLNSSVLTLTAGAAIANASTNDQTISLPIAGTNGLTKTGNGTLTLSAASTYTGGTAINAGRLVALDNAQALGAGNVSIATSAILEVNYSGSLKIAGTTLTGTGTLQKTGTGTLTLGEGPNGGTVNVNLSGGALIDLQAGTLEASSAYQGNWNSNMASLNVAGGATFQVKETQVNVDALTGSGTVQQDWYGNGLYVGVNNGSGTFAGVIQDGGVSLALTKSGTGTQTLSGANTYTGSTTVSNGTLLVNGSLAAGSAVTVASGALGGVGSIGGATTVNAGGYLAPGTNGVGTLTFANNLTLNAASTNNFVVTANGASNNVVVTGTLTPNGSVIHIAAGTALGLGTNTLFTYATNSGAFNATPVFDVAQSNAGSIVNDGAGHINLVMASGVNTNPATASFAASVTGSAGSQTLNFTWAPDHKGWQLYTNAVGLTATGSWFPVPGSASVTNESITVDPTKPNVFFQLRYP